MRQYETYKISHAYVAFLYQGYKLLLDSDASIDNWDQYE